MKSATAMALFAAALAGCATCPDSMVPLEQLVGEYNAQAARVPRLWARARIELTLPNPATNLPMTWGSASPLAAPNGLLLLEKSGKSRTGPHDFVLIGREAGVEIFRLGSSLADDAYYLWYHFGGRGEAWWGLLPLAGAPGVADLPIDPNQLLAVLSVCELPDDFTQPPTVALSMSTQPCAYIVTYLDRQPVSRRIVFRREVYFHWEKDKPRRAFLIHFFDDKGVRTMTASLRDYRPVVGPAVNAEKRPEMPTDIEISWPERKSRIRIRLSEMTTEKNPDPAVFRFVDNVPGGIDPQKVTQVDKDVLARQDRPRGKAK